MCVNVPKPAGCDGITLLRVKLVSAPPDGLTQQHLIARLTSQHCDKPTT